MRQKKNLFEKFKKINEEIMVSGGFDSFRTGFRMGVQIMCECLFYGENEIFKQIK